ncbi:MULTISPECIES: DUF6248 family natural product biosynthesis protein [unclassified Streptomyces]|uniref:DUF6248 family natural product biosynthesis protein n=1 Tax=unclassified Streptomyces TaxID=2593676 RepID=UPI0034507EC7
MDETPSVGDREQAEPRGAGPVIRRPQRLLTREEREIVQGIPLLNFQGALLMGIVDPVPNPSPMSEAEGAWVRERVWPAYLQAIERKYPFGFARWAMCERGTCWNCLANRCDLCVHRQEGGPHVDDNRDWVWSARGRCVAKLVLRPGGELCVWWCRCPCPKTDSNSPAAPAEAATSLAAAAATGLPDRAGHAPRRRGGRSDIAAGPQQALF